MRRTTILLASLAMTASLGLAACGDDSTTDTATTPTPTAAACTDDATVPAASKEFGSEPEIAKPTGEPPCELVTEDLTVGTGKEVTNLETTWEWNYEGVSWSSGEVFDSSFKRGQPIPFALNQVIEGWQEGLIGMKVGGRRMLVIPPAQAYGPAGSGHELAGETLVFVVDLVGPAA